ncbi:MAG: ethanolamine utilization protein EutH [Clostridia bacterium]|nr:ethanolamine utilization protein EutH [Clostridia bacterium]
MNEVLMAIMAFGAVCGGMDRIFGNRFGLGQRFEEGFMLLGPLALSMPGIMCLTPALAGGIRTVLVPVCTLLHLDPGTFGGLLAIDMGGYQLAASLAVNPQIGRFAGILIAATFGCSVVFTIPVGIALIPAEAKEDFIRGLLIGLITLPAGLAAGGIAAGLSVPVLFQAAAPVIVFSLLLAIGMRRHPGKIIGVFGKAARGIQAVSTIGLVLGALEYLTGFVILPGMMPLTDAMEIVVSIGVVMLGSLPFAELLKHLLQKPLELLRRKTGMNADGAAGIMVGIVSVTPALGLFSHMDSRSRVVNGAALVAGASMLGAHFGFTLAVEPSMVPAMFTGKFAGMVCAVLLALLMTGRPETEKP